VGAAKTLEPRPKSSSQEEAAQSKNQEARDRKKIMNMKIENEPTPRISEIKLMDKTLINKELADHSSDETGRSKVDELKGFFTNRVADYKIVEQSVLGEVVVSLLRFNPDEDSLANQPELRAAIWYPGGLWFVLIAPNEPGEHEAMLWLSPAPDDGERIFRHVRGVCEHWGREYGDDDEQQMSNPNRANRI
jgi:hypothetical protein